MAIAYAELSKDGKYILAVNSPKLADFERIRFLKSSIYEISSGREISDLTGVKINISSVKYSPNGKSAMILTKRRIYNSLTGNVSVNEMDIKII